MTANAGTVSCGHTMRIRTATRECPLPRFAQLLFVLPDMRVDYHGGSGSYGIIGAYQATALPHGAEISAITGDTPDAAGGRSTNLSSA